MDAAMIAYISLSHHIRKIVNDVDEDGRSPLFCAARMNYHENYTEVLKILLNLGANLKSADEQCYKSFCTVLQNGDLSAVELMIEHGIDLEDYKNCLPIHVAARNPRVEVLEFFLCSHKFDLNQKDTMGRTALWEAVEFSNAEAVELLLDWGVELGCEVDDHRSILGHVQYENDSEQTTRCIEILLRNGANTWFPTGELISALYLAVQAKYSSQYTKRLKLFFEYSNGTLQHLASKTIWGVARHGDLEAVQLYFNCGVDPTIYVDKFPLHKAVLNPRVEVLEFLLSTGVFNPNEFDYGRSTSLIDAVKNDNFAAVRILLEHGADPNLGDYDGLSPLHYVRYFDDSDEVTRYIEILLRHGANPDLMDERKQSPLDLFAMTSIEESNCSDALVKRLRLFLKYRIDDIANHIYDPAPLAFTNVVKYGSMQEVEEILNDGLDLTKCRNHFLLHNAADNPRVEILQLLLGIPGLDPDWRDEFDETTLHKVARNGSLEAMELLLDYGVDVNALSRKRESALKIAVKLALFGLLDMEKAEKCIELLLAHGAQFNFPGGSDKRFIQFGRIGPRGIRVGALKILMHANLLKSQGRKVHPSFFTIRVTENKRCQDELKSLQAEKLEGSFTLYKILGNGYQGFYSDKMMQKLQDQDYIGNLRSRFPISGDRLIGIIKHLSLKEIAARKLSQLIGFPRDTFYMVIDRIVETLPKRTLRALIDVEIES
ncbi:hypothetical protein QAD02_010159 [Eretmocerus hayati]|uniref:Uncharacterized protein n=1 Tax=Eretmocerus hayati TaxID=131215 RepID=A0ACC2NBS0_9HYME|nr:hypothetical protein QAD02_010159 [Eretmocerus hayati]